MTFDEWFKASRFHPSSVFGPAPYPPTGDDRELMDVYEAAREAWAAALLNPPAPATPPASTPARAD